MLIGALFWGLSADMIGRRLAFNVSLLICAITAILAGTSSSFVVLGFWIAMSSIGGGGNLILDTAVFLEFLPSGKQWMLTLMAAWWGVGQMIAGLFAWPFMCKSGPNQCCVVILTLCLYSGFFLCFSCRLHQG